MKNIIFTLAILLITLTTSAQKKTFSNYRLTEANTVIWTKIYESDLTLEDLAVYFQSKAITSALEVKAGKIVGRSGKTGLSSDKGTAMMARQDFDFFITIEVKEGKYRVTAENLKFNPIKSSAGAFGGGLGLGISSDINGTWEDVAINKGRRVFSTRYAAERFMVTLNNDLISLFKIAEVQNIDW